MEEVADLTDAHDPAFRRLGTRPSDRALLRAARKGSSSAIEALIDRHWDQAQRIAFGILGDPHAAEDVTQEAMLSVVTHIGRFDPYRPFSPWLTAIVTNRALDWSRARARRPEDPASPLPGPEGIEALRERTGPEDRVALGEYPAPGSLNDPELVAALARLSADQRAVIVLRYVAGYGPKEAGKVLGIPAGTVGSRLRRALDRLKEELGDEND